MKRRKRTKNKYWKGAPYEISMFLTDEYWQRLWDQYHGDEEEIDKHWEDKDWSSLEKLLWSNDYKEEE